ncbi:RING-H2 finger protein ATL32 [Zea mays]|jgi:hypothetical protein|uniref:RING-type E3 ubiquitin transferase n=2 Tax=Zea mays TaxID=4577 RepID=A0A1D6FMZ0_MAIZE|nr:RING-H2 finger protein ATL3 [Zea mays]AQK93030.1 RING-H2 finger protein ATL3 [Zea mays]PWZ11683.1 RING-H2 finger protein ATL32 [Zea mays]|eukprot:XP_020397946.1 RING-H2 finger protein ATL3 [Zea mays]
MSTLGSGSIGSVPSASAPEVEGQWAPHGAVLTACVVGINVLVVLFIFGFFWRFFSGKGGLSASDRADDEGDDSLPVASAWASRHRHEDFGGQQTTQVEDVASSLPVSVYTSAGAEEGGKAPECAMCILELNDGDSVRVLPRCGHRFHADCVGLWLRLHITCPLCRGRVVGSWPPPRWPSLISDNSMNAKNDDDVAADCSV